MYQGTLGDISKNQLYLNLSSICIVYVYDITNAVHKLFIYV